MILNPYVAKLSLSEHLQFRRCPCSGQSTEVRSSENIYFPVVKKRKDLNTCSQIRLSFLTMPRSIKSIISVFKTYR